MSQESEQAQEAWYNHMITSGSGIEGKIKLHGDYKAALKADIEKRIAEIEEAMKGVIIGDMAGALYYENKRALKECKAFLSLLDTVTPIK